MIDYCRQRKVKQPTRGKSIKNDRSSGMDFYMPTEDDTFIQSLLRANVSQGFVIMTEGIMLLPHCHVLIPSGICCDLQNNGDFMYSETLSLAMIAFNKSGVGIKQLDVAATVVDEDYQGEIHISLTNTSSGNVMIYFDQKLVQFLLIPVILADFNEKQPEEMFKNSKSSRGCDGFGSTGLQ